MKKTKKELLANFIRSNKKRRLYLAIKAGYETAEEYRVFLEEKKKKLIKLQKLNQLLFLKLKHY